MAQGAHNTGFHSSTTKICYEKGVDFQGYITDQRSDQIETSSDLCHRSIEENLTIVLQEKALPGPFTH